MNASIMQSRHLLSLAERILAGLDDTHVALEPQSGTKTAGWIIGHLAVTGDFARHLCGRRAICPATWRATFNPGTQPSHDPAQYPPMAELCSAFAQVYTDLLVAAEEGDRDALTAENPYEPARGSFPLAGDFVAYLISSHLAYHLGQLVAWRSAAGMGTTATRADAGNSPASQPLVGSS